MLYSDLWTGVESLFSRSVAGVPMAMFILAVATAIEFVAPIERHTLKSRLAPTLYWIIGFAVATASVTLLSGAARALGVRPWVSIPASGFGVAGDAFGICASLLLGDFLAYWYHRFQHRFTWRIHALHHSPSRLNAAADYAHFGESIFRYLLIGLPLTVIHFQFPAAPLVVVGAVALLERYIHMPIDAGMGPLGKVLVSNRFHRIHHSLEPRHFDKNFGVLFSFWDRLFGTAYEPGDEWPAVGIANNPAPANLWQFLVYPLRYRKDTKPSFQVSGRNRDFVLNPAHSAARVSWDSNSVWGEDRRSHEIASVALVSGTSTAEKNRATSPILLIAADLPEM